MTRTSTSLSGMTARYVNMQYSSHGFECFSYLELFQQGDRSTDHNLTWEYNHLLGHGHVGSSQRETILHERSGK